MARIYETNKSKWVSVSVSFYVWWLFCCNKNLWLWTKLSYISTCFMIATECVIWLVASIEITHALQPRFAGLNQWRYAIATQWWQFPSFHWNNNEYHWKPCIISQNTQTSVVYYVKIFPIATDLRSQHVANDLLVLRYIFAFLFFLHIMLILYVLSNKPLPDNIDSTQIALLFEWSPLSDLASIALM